MVETAPTGVISNRAFCDTIMDMTALTVSVTFTSYCVLWPLFFASFAQLCIRGFNTQALKITEQNGATFGVASAMFRCPRDAEQNNPISIY